MKVAAHLLIMLTHILVLTAVAAAEDHSEASAMSAHCTEGSAKGEAPLKIESACTAAIEAKMFQGTRLAMVFLGRANGYDFIGDKARALSDYNKAVELAPDAAGIYYNRGVS